MEIKLKASDIAPVFQVLKETREINGNPFGVYASRLIAKMQPEIEFLQGLSPEDQQAYKDAEIELGNKIPAPEHYYTEHKEWLEKVCEPLPEKKSQLSDYNQNLSKEES